MFESGTAALVPHGNTLLLGVASADEVLVTRPDVLNGVVNGGSVRLSGGLGFGVGSVSGTVSVGSTTRTSEVWWSFCFAFTNVHRCCPFGMLS